LKIKLRELPGELKKLHRRIRKNGDQAVRATARLAIKPIKQRTPKAFGELRDSLHATANKTIADAPHAAAVEVGSAPHTPDMAALIRWVKLRGMQGLKSPSQRRRLAGTTTFQQSTRVASMLKAMKVGKGKGAYTPVDAAERVAFAIAAGIRAKGTKPHWMFRDSLPEIMNILDAEMKKRL